LRRLRGLRKKIEEIEGIEWRLIGLCGFAALRENNIINEEVSDNYMCPDSNYCFLTDKHRMEHLPR
jgi:hypothetical protein